MKEKLEVFEESGHALWGDLMDVVEEGCIVGDIRHPVFFCLVCDLSCIDKLRGCGGCAHPQACAWCTGNTRETYLVPGDLPTEAALTGEVHRPDGLSGKPNVMSFIPPLILMGMRNTHGNVSLSYRRAKRAYTDAHRELIHPLRR